MEKGYRKNIFTMELGSVFDSGSNATKINSIRVIVQKLLRFFRLKILGKCDVPEKFGKNVKEIFFDEILLE